MRQKLSLDKEIDFLSALEEGEIITQMALSQRLSISIGMVNVLLKRAIHKGYVKVKSAPYKRFAYYITPKGFQEKSRLVSEYLHNSLSFFKTAKQDYVNIFEKAKIKGIKNFILVGDGELTDLALLAAIQADVKILGIIKSQTYVENIKKLKNLDDISKSYYLVITKTENAQALYDDIKQKYDESIIIFPKLLNIRKKIKFEKINDRALQEQKKAK